MEKRISAFGNSLGIVIEKPILQLLGIDRNTVFDMTTDGQRIVLTPIREAKPMQPADLLASISKSEQTPHHSTIRQVLSGKRRTSK